MDYTVERAHMVDDLISAGVLRSGKVISAMRKVERHLFVPDDVRDSAYVDCPQPIGLNQTISAPHMVAIMTELLDVKSDSRILEVGTGSGYQAAILSELAPHGKVISIERMPELMLRSRRALQRLGHRNVVVVGGDGTVGVPEYAPYDRVIVTAAAPEMPKKLVDQLAPGGRMLAPVGDRWGQTLIEVEKDGKGDVKGRSHGGCVFVPLIGEDGW